MIIKVKYNKAENTLEVTNDIPECAVIVNPNTLIDNDNELNKIAESAYDYATKRRTWDNTIDETIELYEKIL